MPSISQVCITHTDESVMEIIRSHYIIPEADTYEYNGDPTYNISCLHCQKLMEINYLQNTDIFIHRMVSLLLTQHKALVS